MKLQVYPSVEILIKLLYKLPNEFSFDILQEYYRSFEEELYALNNMEDPLVKSFLSDSQDSEGSIVRNLKELLNVWFLIGIVGKQEGEDLVFSTPNHPCLDEIDFADAMWFEAHPLFAGTCCAAGFAIADIGITIVINNKVLINFFIDHPS